MNREEILRRLVANGVIDEADAASIRESSKATDNEDIIIGYVLGMADAPARVVAGVLDMRTEDVATIEPRKTPLGRRLGGFFGNFSNLFTAEGQQAIQEAGFADDLQRYMADQMRQGPIVAGEREEFEVGR